MMSEKANEGAASDVRELSAGRSAAGVEEWLAARVARSLGVEAARVDRHCAPTALGLDSVEAVEIAEELAEWLDRPLPPTLFWDHPSLRSLAAQLAGGPRAPASSSAPEGPSFEAAAGASRPSAAPDAPSPAATPGARSPEAWADAPLPETTTDAEAFAQVVNPHLGKVLASLRLDKSFVRGEGSYLFDAAGRRYLDFLAMYGALPFGHNPPEIWAALNGVAAAMEPNFVQPSALPAASALARRLLAVAPAGLRHVTFANSGAEAVEVAIKLSRSATGRPGILSARRSFHGKTLGALSATGNAKYQRAFAAPAPGFDKVEFGDLDALRAALAARPGHYAAFLVEPIQAEGGVVEPPPGYLPAAQALCRAEGVLFVVDEVQTGLGRTGAMFACEAEGLRPDALVVAKALGGGLMPVGACLCRPEVFSPEFGLRHSSTFAGNALAARAGLATLERLERDGRALVGDVARHGAALREGLLGLRARYPRLIKEVRGRGFLLGLRFGADRHVWPRSLLGTAAERGVLAALFASYLLNAEGLRVAPTLNGSDVLRVEPPLTATAAECDEALAALGRALAAFEAGDAGRVFRAILDGAPASPASPSWPPASPSHAPASSPPSRPSPPSHARARAPARPEPAAAEAGDARFGFVLHPTEIESYVDFDPSLRAVDADELRSLLGDDPDDADPAVFGTVRLRGAGGASAYGELVLLPRTAAELTTMPRARALAEVRRAVEFARDRGAEIVGLGAFTSIVSQGGLALLDAGVPLTTGNSFTALSIGEAVDVALAGRREAREPPAVAVLGAAGSIGRAAAVLLAERASRLILAGNPAGDAAHNRARLRRVAGEACRHLAAQREAGVEFAPGSLGARLARAFPVAADAPLERHCEAADALGRLDGGFLLAGGTAAAVLPLADVVVVATSATRPLVNPGALKRGAVVCDASRPRNVSPEAARQRPDVLVVDGGVIEVPGRTHVGDFGLDTGLVYACMAETMMLALERRFRHCSVGVDLPLETVLEMRRLAAKHGFRVAELRSFDRPVSGAGLPGRRAG